MDVLKKIVHILSFVCYGLIAVYALICAPMIFGLKPEVVTTGSMTPTYNIGSIIYYKKVDKAEIQVGDAVSYRMNNGEIVTHRVVDIENGNYITQGDANNVKDASPVPYDNVEGKIVGPVIPVLGYAVAFVNTHILVVFIVVAILLAEFLLSNIKRGTISVSEKGQSQEKEDQA